MLVCARAMAFVDSRTGVTEVISRTANDGIFCSLRLKGNKSRPCACTKPCCGVVHVRRMGMSVEPGKVERFRCPTRGRKTLKGGMFVFVIQFQRSTARADYSSLALSVRLVENIHTLSRQSRSRDNIAACVDPNRSISYLS